MPGHNATVSRIRAEFLEMPGLSLTLDQAQRLLGVERAVCKTILDALVDAKFLRVKANGSYVRLTEGQTVATRPTMPRPDAVKRRLPAV